MQLLENDFNEQILGGRHASGMRVHLIQKPGFSRVSGILTTRFGSIDARLPNGTALPAGIAHFLEHQMFESDSGDVAERFARLGASSNAFTSFTTTSYVFETSSNAESCVDLLLELVREPYFTLESVEKERGVIAQEIRMVEDDPGSRLFHQLLASLYSEHPLAEPIAGSAASISKIDPELLYSCHEAFYSAPNLSLAIAGDLDCEQLLAAIDRRFTPSNSTPASARPSRVRNSGVRSRNQSVAKMDVARSKWLLGIRDEFEAHSALELLKHELSFGIVLELLLSPSSELHASLLADGQIDDSYGYDATIEAEFGFLAIGSDLDSVPAAGAAIEIEQRILGAIERQVGRGFSPTDFERARRKRMGRMAQFFDSVEGVAHAFANLALEGLTPFDWFDALNRLTLSEVDATARSFFADSEHRRARSLVLPLSCTNSTDG